MDADLYDEFGNYIGPELDSDSDEDVDDARQQIQEAFEYADVSNSNISNYSTQVVDFPPKGNGLKLIKKDKFLNF